MVYRLIRDKTDLDIAEIGGGDSRILERLAINNRCSNIEKFEGRDLGPKGAIKLNNVRNINAYIGDFSQSIQSGTFDLIFSISVVEHIETQNLDLFFRDMIRILKPGGIFIHAVDMYLDDNPSAYHIERYAEYKGWVLDNPFVLPLGQIYDGAPRFSTDMASNPDNILYGWNTLAPSLSELRSKAQSVSLMVGGIKS